MIDDLTVEARKKRYWQFIRDSEDSSHSGVVISPDGWRDAVEWLLKYCDHLEHQLTETKVLRDDLTDRLRYYRGGA